MLSMIVAHDRNFVIGYQGWMPWKLKDDLKLFKQRTLGHKIVMGLNTYKTIGKPLPGRQTIIVCHPEEATITDPAIRYCHDLVGFLKANADTAEEIFICGGASIYAQAMPYCRKLYISLVDGEHEADTWLKRYDPADYHILSRTPYDGFTVIEYLKKD